MRLRVYVAGPISVGDLQANVNQARVAGDRLLKAGYAPMVPHLTCFWAGNTPEIMPCGTTHEDWMGVDLPWVSVCQALLRLPGQSKGADLEVICAHEHGIPVFHSVDEFLLSQVKDHVRSDHYGRARQIAKHLQGLHYEKGQAVIGKAAPPPRRETKVCCGGPRIVGFAGRAGSGKDTCGKALESLGFVKVSFADKLKDVIADVYNLPREKLDDFAFKEKPHPNLHGMTPRRALQLIGTEGFRNLVYDNTWIDAAHRTVQDVLALHRGVYMADIRFPNELLALKAWGGVMVFVERPDVQAVAAHVSEQHNQFLQANSDHVITNNGTVQELTKAVLDWFAQAAIASAA